MAILDTKFEVSTDASTGLARIRLTGRCTTAEVAAIENGCTRRFELVTLPASRGAVLKALDGTAPQLVTVQPTTTGRTYRCVKVDGRANAHAYTQTAGPYAGQAINRYEIVYQEVGAVA